MADAPEKARRRWYRLMPDRCVLALLALEAFCSCPSGFSGFR